jgi:biofilm PGA synthesis N-glycosyltransferase PgaC
MPTKRKRKLALLIPAHNEELVIEHTLRSAISAGLSTVDIYVVDDDSSDQTSNLSRQILGSGQVLKVERSGKAAALHAAISYFDLISKYTWIHIADADGVFEQSYFRELKSKLNARKYVAATGYVQSLRGPWVSKYRTYEYTIGLEIIRRLQSALNVISVIPGASACYRSTIIPKLNFYTHSFTEDFDLTIQIHRRKLGAIQYIPKARALTQDPKDYRDYVQQIIRWYRGFFQGVKRYRIGRRLKKLDVYLGIIMLDAFLYASQLLLILPFMLFWFPKYVATYFILDITFFMCLIIASAAFNKRWDILTAFPLFYVLRITNVVIFSWAFVEVILLGRFNEVPTGWGTSGRRYRIS